ncbi:MAG: tyrosinase [Acidobacteriota bacterium]|jgi:tyrosinase|nr:tyrosinase [Acidobacteriota bacterium]
MANTTPTRYQRIVDILDCAAAAGADRFWFPREKLLTARVHGIAMIAPEEKAKPACACCAPVSSGDAAPFPGRGAKSGLVRGLRGEAPFDGTQFPRLLWGGTPVAGDDIDFIANWIDDGLPEADRETSLPATTRRTDVKLESIEAKNVETIAQIFAVDGSPNDYAFQYGEPKQRMNVDCLMPGQLEQFRLAFRELYRLNKWPEDRRSYNNMALIHQNHCQHGWERFLPWHRVYLYELEQIMQDLVPGVTIPYWDWTMPQYIPEKPEDGWIIPESYKAFITNASLDFLTNAKPALPKKAADILAEQLVGRLYTSQTTFFAAVAKALGDPKTPLIKGRHRERFIDALLAANSLWYPLRYPAEYGKDNTINTTFHYHYPTADDICQIMSLRTFRDFGGGSLYNDSFGYLDQNPHNTLHIWSGGVNPFPGDDDEFDAPTATSNHRNRSVKVAGRLFHSREDMYSRPEYGDMLSNLTASFDPVFWPIHVNIDRLWSEWQAMNPHSLPADLGAVLTPWSYTIEDTLDMTQFGYEYVKCSYLIPVGLSTPVARFVSKAIDIPEPARRSFKQAEVRLHRVPQLPRSCFIRVFLNLPDADASTPIDHENYAGYLAIFGHGECIGGPGHCELPPSRPRQHDIRPRNHNTPRNHRINVTKSARYLFEKKKAKSLQITLVVIGADYREDTELLCLDGVSLDLLD